MLDGMEGFVVFKKLGFSIKWLFSFTGFNISDRFSFNLDDRKWSATLKYDF